MHEKQILTRSPQEGSILSMAGGDYRIIISGKETDGAYASIEMTVPPGAGPPPHSHPEIDESFFVLEGEVLFHSEDGNFIAKKGAYVRIPKGGLIHQFKNMSDQPAKLLCTVFPAGLEIAFEETALYLKEHPEMPLEEKKKVIVQIAEQHGSKLFPPNYFG